MASVLTRTQLIILFLAVFIGVCFAIRNRNGGEILAVYSQTRQAVIYNNNSSLLSVDESTTKCEPAKECKQGVLLPVWEPHNVSNLRVF